MKVRRVSHVVTTLIAALAMSVIPASAQVGHNPFQATPVAGVGSGWEVTGVTPLDIAGTAIALSPDGTTIAGLGVEGMLCFWAVDGLEQSCTEVDAGAPPLNIDPDSIAWAPDSSAVAFSVLAYRYLTDGDIYVVEREGTTVQNITDDGIEKTSLFADDSPPTPIDVMPAWTPDSGSIVFSRTVFDDREELSNEIMRVSLDGGEPETLLTLPGLPGAIFLPMHVLSDGSVLYTVGFNDTSEPANGLWLLSPEGDPTQLVPGTVDADFPMPMANDVWEGDGERRIIGHSPLLVAQFDTSRPFAFVWSSNTGLAEPIAAEPGDPGATVYPGAISPDGGTLLSLVRPLAEQPVVALQGPVSSSTELPEFETGAMGGRPIYRIASWSSANLVLIAPYLTNGAYLLTVEPA